MVKEYDSISICLSKGLGTPVGSVLVGSSEFISKAHRWRKMFGGGMRQAGVLPACGISALENHIERLQEVHQRTKHLAKVVNSIDGFNVDLDSVETNMVYIEGDIGAKQILENLAKHGIDVLEVGPTAVRAVVHLHITDEDIERTIQAFQSI